MEMLRVVGGPQGEAVFDLDGRLPGRGAYVCPALPCLGSLRASSLSHVLKKKVALPPLQRLRGDLAGLIEERIASLLSIGRKSGKVAVGAEAVREALQHSRAALVLVAADAAARTASIPRQTGRAVLSVTVADRRTLGRWLSRDSVALAAVTDRGIGRRLGVLTERLTEIAPCSYDGADKSAEED